MVMPTASMREYAFGLVKASFQALIIFSLRYRKRYRLASREEHIKTLYRISMHYNLIFSLGFFTGTECRGLSLKKLSRKACVRRWWNGKLVFKFQHLARTTISKKWKPLKVFSWFFFILQTSKTIINFKITTMKKETWKLVIQLIVSVLTAVATTLGVTSCV